MADVLIVGGGPAGAVAAMILARQGVRVRVLDRARFPRPKLCGDTLNPGTLATLRRLGVAEFIDRRGLPIEGMIVTAHGVRVQAAYGKGICGCALERRELDWWLLGEAARAGAQIEEQTYVRGAVIDDPSSASSHVRGVVVAGRDGRSHTVNAPVTIAADGRHSTIAFGLGLARHPAHPRRWAIGQRTKHHLAQHSLHAAEPLHLFEFQAQTGHFHILGAETVEHGVVRHDNHAAVERRSSRSACSQSSTSYPSSQLRAR
jgi:flavin-dependent dehydrogenase